MLILNISPLNFHCFDEYESDIDSEDQIYTESYTQYNPLITSYTLDSAGIKFIIKNCSTLL